MGNNSSKNVILGYYKDVDNKIQPYDSSKINLNSQEIRLSSLNLIQITSYIGLLRNLTSINLSSNKLAKIPLQIGYCVNLVSINIADNELVELPETLGYCRKLKKLEVQNNRIAIITKSVIKLTKLKKLNLKNNHLTEVPIYLSCLADLSYINLSNNDIPYFPAEISNLKKLRTLEAENCPLITILEKTKPKIKSLREISSIKIIEKLDDNKLDFFLPRKLIKYLNNAKFCSYCSKPYFETYYEKLRFITKDNIRIPLIYRLCSLHFNNDKERIQLLFSQNQPKMESNPDWIFMDYALIDSSIENGSYPTRSSLDSLRFSSFRKEDRKDLTDKLRLIKHSFGSIGRIHDETSLNMSLNGSINLKKKNKSRLSIFVKHYTLPPRPTIKANIEFLDLQ